MSKGMRQSWAPALIGEGWRSLKIVVSGLGEAVRKGVIVPGGTIRGWSLTKGRKRSGFRRVVTVCSSCSSAVVVVLDRVLLVIIAIMSPFLFKKCVVFSRTSEVLNIIPTLSVDLGCIFQGRLCRVPPPGGGGPGFARHMLIATPSLPRGFLKLPFVRPLMSFFETSKVDFVKPWHGLLGVV